MSHYMHLPVFQTYYNLIKGKNTPESFVNRFWSTLLPRYFTADKNFGLERESKIFLEELDDPPVADIVIDYIKNGDSKKVAILEDKRMEFASQTSEWKKALKKLSRYMKIARAKSTGADQTIYGIVNIGVFTRFYQLDPYAQDCVDFDSDLITGEALELKDDEQIIHDVLTDIVEKTSH